MCLIIQSAARRMLITIINTISDGKLVLHKFPYEKVQIEQEGFDKLPPSDIFQAISNTFDYFAVYRKNCLIQTSKGPLPEKAIVEMFMANEKSSQIVLGIDDNCVLVSRSAFFSNRSATQPQNAETEFLSENAAMIDVPQNGKSQVISVSLIWQQDSFEGVEEAKHKLSFLLGVLQRKEQHEQFLTREFNKIMEEKQRLRRRIKDLITLNTRENAASYEEIRIKILAREIDATAKNIRDQLPLFIMLRRYYESWVKGEVFEVREHETNWEGTMCSRVVIRDPPPSFQKEIQFKTLVILPPKLAELPPVLYSERVRQLYSKGFSYNHYSLKKLLEKNKDIEPRQLYHTAYFLLRNNLAVDIYPIAHPYSYNLFYLKDLPPKSLIQKFNNKIFPGKNFLDIISPYSKYKLAYEEEETLKYLLLKGIVGEVSIFIYKKFSREHEQPEQSQRMLRGTLEEYSMAEYDLGYMLAKQPFNNKEGMLLNSVFKFIKNHPRHWGFYFVERS